MIQRNSKQLVNQNLLDEDLLCDESMDELMDRTKMLTPRLIHLPSFSEELAKRSSSLKLSSRCR